MMRMKYSSLQFVLPNIERDITPIELAEGGLKPISPGECLTFNLLFLATGKSVQSFSISLNVQFSPNFSAISL